MSSLVKSDYRNLFIIACWRKFLHIENYQSKMFQTNDFITNYNLIIQEKNGKVEVIFNISSSSPVFTSEEIGYFLYYINTHIRTLLLS